MAKSVALAAHLFGVEQRRAERDEVFFTTRLSIGGETMTEVQLVNLSPFGFLVRTAIDVPERSLVELFLPMVGKLPAKVVWALGGRLGGEFLKPVEPDAYGDILMASQSMQSGLWRD